MLEPPLGEGSNSAIWEVGFGTAAIHSFKTESDDVAYLDHHRYRVRELVGYRSLAYWRDFTLLYWNADQPTGLYQPRSSEDIAHSVERMGFCREECGVWGNQLITRREYDDGSVFRDGRLLRASARLRVRNLAAGVTFIVAQLSPVNDLSADRQRESLLKDHMAGRASLKDIVDWVESLPRHRRDNY